MPPCNPFACPHQMCLSPGSASPSWTHGVLQCIEDVKTDIGHRRAQLSAGGSGSVFPSAPSSRAATPSGDGMPLAAFSAADRERVVREAMLQPFDAQQPTQRPLTLVFVRGGLADGAAAQSRARHLAAVLKDLPCSAHDRRRSQARVAPHGHGWLGRPRHEPLEWHRCQQCQRSKRHRG